MKNKFFRLLALMSLAVLLFASCATKKKYGCPGHITVEKLLNF